MYFKFLENGVGDPARAASYLIDDKDHLNRPRAGVQVLRGDPNTFSALAKSSLHKYKYTSVVIAWAEEDKLSDQDISEVLDAFEQHTFVGLEPHQYHMTAVMHVEDSGAKHVHILVPRIELTSGKSLNIAPPGHRYYFDPLRDYFNYRNNWARPDDPTRSRDSKLPNHIYFENAAAMHVGLKGKTQKHRIQLIDQFILHRILSGVVTNRESIIQSLKEIGTITRVGEDYITLKTDDVKQRLNAAFYHEQFSVQNYLQNRSRTTGAQRTRDQIREDVERDRQKAKQCFEQVGRVRAKREQYNRQHYPDISAVPRPSESTVPEFSRNAEHSSPSRREYQPTERSDQQNELNQLTQSKSDSGSERREARVRDLYQQTAEIIKQNRSQSPQAKQGMGRENEIDSIRQHTYSAANAIFQNAEWTLRNDHIFNFNSSYLEVNRDNDRIRPTESGILKSATDSNRTIETAKTNASEYRRQLEEDCGNTEALSNSIRRENSAIRNRVEAHQVNNQNLRAGAQKGVSLTRSKHFFNRLKTNVIRTLKSLFESSRNYRTDQTTGRSQSETTSTESQSLGLSRLVSFARQRSTQRRITDDNIERITQLEHHIQRVDTNLQNASRVIKRTILPKQSLDIYLRDIHENNQGVSLMESIQDSLQADQYMRNLIKKVQKDPYGQEAKYGLSIDYARVIKKCLKNVADQMVYIRSEDFKFIEGFVQTVKCYLEMLELNHPDIERTPNYFHVNEMVQDSISDIEDRIQGFYEKDDVATVITGPLKPQYETPTLSSSSTRTTHSSFEM